MPDSRQEHTNNIVGSVCAIAGSCFPLRGATNALTRLYLENLYKS